MIDKEQTQFKNANEFSMHIERSAHENKITHMEAVLKYCEDNMIDPQDIVKKINKSLKDKIALNMQDLNYLPKQASLDYE
jgi:cell division ATPase FtsA